MLQYFNGTGHAVLFVKIGTIRIFIFRNPININKQNLPTISIFFSVKLSLIVRIGLAFPLCLMRRNGAKHFTGPEFVEEVEREFGCRS